MISSRFFISVFQTFRKQCKENSYPSVHLISIPFVPRNIARQGKGLICYIQDIVLLRYYSLSLSPVRQKQIVMSITIFLISVKLISTNFLGERNPPSYIFQHFEIRTKTANMLCQILPQFVNAADRSAVFNVPGSPYYLMLQTFSLYDHHHSMRRKLCGVWVSTRSCLENAILCLLSRKLRQIKTIFCKILIN